MIATVRNMTEIALKKESALKIWLKVTTWLRLSLLISDLIEVTQISVSSLVAVANCWCRHKIFIRCPARHCRIFNEKSIIS